MPKETSTLLVLTVRNAPKTRKFHQFLLTGSVDVSSATDDLSETMEKEKKLKMRSLYEWVYCVDDVLPYESRNRGLSMHWDWCVVVSSRSGHNVRKFNDPKDRFEGMPFSTFTKD